jgi:tetratricopeptide (TPR) repeat protein
MLLVLAGWAQAVSPQDRPEQPPNQTPYALEEQATKAYDNKQYAESVRLFDAAFAAGLNRSDDAYAAACSSALAGDAAKALAYLDRAAGLGFRDAEHMKADTDLASVRPDPRFRTIVERVQENEQAYQRAHSDPNRAAIVTSDIDLFWDAYASLQASPHPEGLIENEYFHRGSPGLQDFIFARIYSASDLWSTMKRAPKYYAAIRHETLRIKDFTPRIRDSFRRMKELYPPSTFPDVYVLIGRMNSAGTTGSLCKSRMRETYTSGLTRGEAIVLRIVPPLLYRHQTDVCLWAAAVGAAIGPVATRSLAVTP